MLNFYISDFQMINFYKFTVGLLLVNHIFVIGYNSVYCTGKIGKPTLKIEAYAEADHRNNRSKDLCHT